MTTSERNITDYRGPLQEQGVLGKLHILHQEDDLPYYLALKTNGENAKESQRAVGNQDSTLLRLVNKLM